MSRYPGLLALALLVYQSPTALAAPDDNLEFALRVRSETVKRQSDHADALTLKLRINGTRVFNSNLKGFVQLDHVQSFLDNKHSDGVLATNEPVIADPAGSEVNQLNLQYTLGTTEFTLGRQIIDHGDHRFVGDVGFRQNDQTYDGLRIQHDTIGGLEIDYAFISKVNRIFGNDAGTTLKPSDSRFNDLDGERPAQLLGNHRVDAHLFRGTAKVWDYVDLSAFSYFIHNRDAANFSNRTIGTSADFKYKLGNIKWSASLIFAQQKQQEQPIESWLNFYRWELGAELNPFTLSLRQEYFEERDGIAFTTPLATLHKFQGWADQFLATPSSGLVDNSILILWRKRPFMVDFRIHLFDTVLNKTSIAREYDLDLIFKPDRKHEFSFRFAKFNPLPNQNIRSRGVRKIFLIYSYNF